MYTYIYIYICIYICIYIYIYDVVLLCFINQSCVYLCICNYIISHQYIYIYVQVLGPRGPPPMVMVPWYTPPPPIGDTPLPLWCGVVVTSLPLPPLWCGVVVIHWHATLVEPLLPPVVWCGRHPLALHIDVQTVLAAENVGKDVLVEYSNYMGNM